MKFKFRTLIKQHQQQVYSLAMHMLRSQAEAEDITQEVYIKLWRNITDIELSTAKSWLIAVTRNLCIDQTRGRRGNEDLENFEFECKNESLQPANALINSHLSQWLKNAIGSLKEPYRSLVVMSDLQQKSQNEMAQVLGLSVTQVKVYIHRARQQLREYLQEVK